MKANISIAALLVFAAGAARAEAPRVEIPIREVVLGNGARIFSIPIKIGTMEIEAGLDTGSSGLRVLPGTLAPGDARESGGSANADFSSGVIYEGKTAKGSLSIGALSAPVSFQAVAALTCAGNKPDCPAVHIAPADYGKSGNSLTGGRFRAVLGINMAEGDIPSPLPAMGVARWIVELPRPDSGEAGRLILNPSADEVKNFVLLPTIAGYRRGRGGLHDSVRGCVVNMTDKAKACGALLMDSGVSGVQANIAAPWPDGAPAALAFYDADHLAAIENFQVGQTAAARLAPGNKAEGNNAMVVAGSLPYLAFDVLYDPAKMMVGLKPRPVAPGVPSGEMVAAPAQ